MWRDDAYLLDMLKAAWRCREYTSKLTPEELKQSQLHQDAIFRTLEIIGEAAGNISQETRQVHKDIPWDEIIGMRNRLIHEYFRIDLTKVWETATLDIPALIKLLEKAVPPE